MITKYGNDLHEEHDRGMADNGPTGDAVTVRYFAAARAAAGVSDESLRANSADGVTLEWLLTALTHRHGERLGTVFKAASFLVNGVAWTDRDAQLPADATVDVLPPFAGG